MDGDGFPFAASARGRGAKNCRLESSFAAGHAGEGSAYAPSSLAEASQAGVQTVSQTLESLALAPCVHGAPCLLIASRAFSCWWVCKRFHACRSVPLSFPRVPFHGVPCPPIPSMAAYAICVPGLPLDRIRRFVGKLHPSATLQVGAARQIGRSSTLGPRPSVPGRRRETVHEVHGACACVCVTHFENWTLGWLHL